MLLRLPPTPTNRLQGRLLNLAALFLAFFAVSITLSPAVRARSWQVDLRWEIWIGFTAWLVLFNLAHYLSDRWLPGRDAYLLPVAGCLSGLGLLTIWRLNPSLGWRQTAWLVIAVGFLIAGLRLPGNLGFLRRYKYLWLTCGLLLTALTFILGTNPLGYGPRLWVGCCGIYLQPSEPLKFLLIAYLAAYLADHQATLLLPASIGKKTRFPLFSTPLLPILAPTLIMVGLALGLLLIQRDLGTASIFLFLYAGLVYLSSGQYRVVIFSGLALIGAGLAGAYLFDVVRVRLDAWVNPWLDPSGRSYQIVQALIAMANGGLLGRGPGLGNPNLVPVAHSDFIFSAIVEENGLIGALAVLFLLGILVNRGLRIAFRASHPYQRLLTTGLTAYLVGQSLLIMGGNLRLFPLTGVTLPFISYGGSSLVTSFLALLILLLVSNQAEEQTAPRFKTAPFLQISAVILLGLMLAGLVTGWWTLVRSSSLLTRTDNPRRAIADRFVQRGAILDRSNRPINQTNGAVGQYTRQYLDPQLSVIVGYTHATFGQSGMEASLDDYLRGLKGNPGYLVEWEQLLYGQPPPGRNIRLTLDLSLQQMADEQLGLHTGAVVIMNAQTGEILAMASHPGFDANQLDNSWNQLIHAASAPLLNRAAQGLYPVGAAASPFLLAGVLASQGSPPALPTELNVTVADTTFHCSTLFSEPGWTSALVNGCPGATLTLGEALGANRLQELLQELGFYQDPGINLPAGTIQAPAKAVEPALTLFQDLRASPLQMALAIAPLSAVGIQPAARLVSAVDTFQTGWVLFPETHNAQYIFTTTAVDITQSLLVTNTPTIWKIVTVNPNGADKSVAWFLGGTLSNTANPPIVIAVLLEEKEPDTAVRIGQTLLAEAIGH